MSVSMLSEGWDVKNVFQIVPHEERAFNSKLLIAQVLGRGLRRPDGWKGEEPVVTVFIHDSWSNRIKHLVNEILEIERRLTSTVDPASPHNFELHNLDYTREEDIRFKRVSVKADAGFIDVKRSGRNQNAVMTDAFVMRCDKRSQGSGPFVQAAFRSGVERRLRGAVRPDPGLPASRPGPGR